MKQHLGSEHLLVEQKGNVLVLTLNRPEALNAFSPSMIEGLHDAILHAKEEESIRAIILAGAGRSFSAGGDVKGMGENTPVAVYEHIGLLNELILAMRDLPKPIIAAVHGFAAGAAFNLALAADIIFAAESSSFILSFSKVGLISDGGGLFHLPRLIGPYKAKELLFNAEPLPAAEANRLGIVNQVYPLEELELKTIEYANKLAAGPSKAYGSIKKLANQSLVSSLDEILELERITQAMIATTDDHKEGVQAFKDKRVPEFNGN
jgi:2-(1,2-epoxy-1,2-dihydrophenyl)acetyl-CoA isomerase